MTKLVYADWIPSLVIKEQAIDSARQPQSSQTAPFTNISILRDPAIRPSAIGQDPGLLDRLIQHLDETLQQDPKFAEHVPETSKTRYDILQQDLEQMKQVREADVDTAVAACLTLVLAVLQNLSIESKGWRIKPQDLVLPN